ncbi:hypothetical protein OEZ86_005310 [Tetradesmus obliquus]|nr:hypothetical protein OEZ86_005310 [Tetradesmus obliquus]
MKALQMPGTSKDDFLTLAQFMYPILPLPKVSWDNLEVLLVQGHKWDMQVVLGHAGEFLQANASSLDLSSNSPHYAFKWLQLADAAGLIDACKACVDRIVALDRSSCTAETLASLSRQTLMLHSAVLAEALNLAPSSKGAAATKEIQMPGTSKDDFLTLAQFMYPIVPLPKVSWDNLKVLLVEGHK